jgi:Uncharacterised nucleotidyltransferase
LNPADGLLHLIVQSAYGHQFNKATLILNDIAEFLKSANIDWDHFWKIADAGGWRKGCVLLFVLTAYYHGERGIE